MLDGPFLTCLALSLQAHDASPDYLTTILLCVGHCTSVGYLDLSLPPQSHSHSAMIYPGTQSAIHVKHLAIRSSGTAGLCSASAGDTLALSASWIAAFPLVKHVSMQGCSNLTAEDLVHIMRKIAAADVKLLSRNHARYSAMLDLRFGLDAVALIKLLNLTLTSDQRGCRSGGDESRVDHSKVLLGALLTSSLKWKKKWTNSILDTRHYGELPPAGAMAQRRPSRKSDHQTSSYSFSKSCNPNYNLRLDHNLKLHQTRTAAVTTTARTSVTPGVPVI
ncbi:hypothetical protein C8R48DRAFT_780085 [Suillus tomentosus]|nr:hypothetical protein C8R48DRAFT_780085 [Suillus tomentosus]